MNSRRIVLSIITVFLVNLVACTPAAPPAAPPAYVEKRHALRGEVIRLDEKERIAVIKHEEMKDFMEAMTMGFPVPEPAEFAKLKVGMKVRATVVERKDDFYLTAVTEAQ